MQEGIVLQPEQVYNQSNETPLYEVEETSSEWNKKVFQFVSYYFANIHMWRGLRQMGYGCGRGGSRPCPRMLSMEGSGNMYAHIHTYAYIYIYIDLCVYTCIYIYIYEYVWFYYIYMCVYYICNTKLLCFYMCKKASIPDVYMYIHVYIYIYIYIYTYCFIL